jgi:hypothetical protein
MTSIEHDLAILKEHTVDKAEAFAAVLSGADSRVPVELVFDQTIGQIFCQTGGRQYRDAGNYRQSRIGSRCPRYQGCPRTRPYQLRGR